MAETPTPPVNARELAAKLRTAVERHLDIVQSAQQAGAALKGTPTPPQPAAGQAGTLRRS